MVVTVPWDLGMMTSFYKLVLLLATRYPECLIIQWPESSLKTTPVRQNYDRQMAAPMLQVTACNSFMLMVEVSVEYW